MLPIEYTNLNKSQPQLFDQFWDKETTWNERKILAEENMLNQSYVQKYNMQFLAFNGEYELIKKIIEYSFNYKILLKYDNLGLTPLIYSIWGEINRNDGNQQTSKIIISFIYEHFKKEHKYLSQISSYEDYLLEYKQLKYELGHVLLHSNIHKLTIASLIRHDYDTSLQYIFECDKFEQESENPHTHIYISVHNKSEKCTDLILKYYSEKLAQPAESLKIAENIKNDLVSILKSKSKYTLKILNLVMGSQKQLFRCDPVSLPICYLMKCSSIGEVSKRAYNILKSDYSIPEAVSTIIHYSFAYVPKVPGSLESVKFLQQLISLNSLAIYRCALIKYYIKYKWEKLWLLILFENLILLLNVIILILIVMSQSVTKNSIISFACVSGVLVVLEILQMSSYGLSGYFGVASLKEKCIVLRFVLLCVSYLIKSQEVIYLIFFILSIPVMPKFHRRIISFLYVGIVFILYCAVYYIVTFTYPELYYIGVILGLGMHIFLTIGSLINKFTRKHFFEILITSLQSNLVISILLSDTYSLTIIFFLDQ